VTIVSRRRVTATTERAEWQALRNDCRQNAVRGGISIACASALRMQTTARYHTAACATPAPHL